MASLAPAEKAPSGKPLKVGSPHDPAEREADRIADLLTAPEEPAMPVCAACAAGGAPCAACGGGGDGAGVVRRQVADGGAEARARGQSVPLTVQGIRPVNEPSREQVPPSVHHTLAGAGAPLDAPTQQYMERRLGQDFSSVRVHTDSDANKSAREIGADAYTSGTHIVFSSGYYQPNADAGQVLLAHELAHVLQQQQSGQHLVQRSVTRGAGGCASPDAVDEDSNGSRGAGRLAHTQIQAFLLPRLMNEVEIPRATKNAINSRDCQGETVESGRADLYRRDGSIHEIGEIKPFRSDMSHAVEEVDHYIRRASQSLDRFFGANTLCQGAIKGDDDNDFARRVGVSRLSPSYSRVTGILTSDTVIGDFTGDNSKTLKARLHAPGAVGYWCTGGTSDTFTCGVSDAEMERYIDRVALQPAQSALESFIRIEVEERLRKALEQRSLGEILAIAERHFGERVRALLRPVLGPLADQILSRATAQEIGRILEEKFGPEARSIVVTLIRQIVDIFVSEMRQMLRTMLRSLIREALLALCVGVPVITLVELLDRLNQSLRKAVVDLAPVVMAIVAMRIAQIIATMIGQMLADIAALIGRVVWSVIAFIGDVVLTLLAVLADILRFLGMALLLIGVFLAAAFLLAPEAAVALAALALLLVLPSNGGRGNDGGT